MAEDYERVNLLFGDMRTERIPKTVTVPDGVVVFTPYRDILDASFNPKDAD